MDALQTARTHTRTFPFLASWSGAERRFDAVPTAYNYKIKSRAVRQVEIDLLHADAHTPTLINLLVRERTAVGALSVSAPHSPSPPPLPPNHRPTESQRDVGCPWQLH